MNPSRFSKTPIIYTHDPDVVLIYSELLAHSMWAHNYKVQTQKSFRNDNREGGNYLTYFEELAKQSNNNPGDDCVCNTISAKRF